MTVLPPNQFERHETVSEPFDDPATEAEAKATDRTHFRHALWLAVFSSLTTPTIILGTAFLVGGPFVALYSLPGAAVLGAIFFLLSRIAVLEGLASGGIPGIKIGSSAVWLILSRTVPSAAISTFCFFVFLIWFVQPSVDREQTLRDVLSPGYQTAYQEAGTTVDKTIGNLAEREKTIRTLADATTKSVLDADVKIKKDQEAQETAQNNLVTARRGLACEERGSHCDEASGLAGHKWRADLRQLDVANAQATLDAASDRVQEDLARSDSAKKELAAYEQQLSAAQSAVTAATINRATAIEALIAANPAVVAARAPHGPVERLNTALGLVHSVGLWSSS